MTEYGNITLGKYYDFVRNILGTDVLKYFYEKLPADKKKHNSTEASLKAIDRICKENGCDYRLLAVENSPITDITKYFFESISQNYGFSSEIYTLLISIQDRIKEFFVTYPGVVYSQNIKEICPHPTFELKTSELFYIMFLFPRFYNGVLNISNHRVALKHYIRPINEQYKEVFTEISKLSLFGSKEKLYLYLDENFSIKQNESILRFKKIINKCQKDGKNPSWVNFEFIIDTIKVIEGGNLFSRRLLSIYLVNNLMNTMKKTMQIPIEKIKSFKKVILDYVETGDSQYFFKAEKIELDKIIYCNKTVTSSKVIYKLIDDIFLDKIYLTNLNYMDAAIEEVVKDAPHSSSFFVPWVRGFIEVAKRNYSEARTLYKEAFIEGRMYAGTYLEEFLKQAISLSIYFDNSSVKVRKAIDPKEKNISPINKDAKQYLDYGYAYGIFEKQSDEAFIEFFRRYDNFHLYFPLEMFYEDKESEKIESELFIKDKNIFFNDLQTGDTVIDFINRQNNEIFNKLSNITEVKINNLVKNYPSDDLFTPLSLCFLKINDGTCFLNLAEEWLGESGDSPAINSLDINKLNFNGSTALHEAITKYKELRQHRLYLDMNNKQKDFHNRVRKLIFRIITLADVSSFGETKRNKIHVLQEAINSYDLDIVKAIVNKGLDINTLLISADKISPLYYTIQNIKYLKSSNVDNLSNIEFNNLNVPGLTKKEKLVNVLKIRELNKELGIIPNLMGNKTTFHKQRDAFLDIINFIAGKESYIDDFMVTIDSTPIQKVSALYLAAELDDVDVCSALINHNANPLLYLGHTEIIPNTFIYRAITFKSWSVLKYCLTDLKEVFRQDLNRMHGKLDFTPLSYFIHTVFNSDLGNPTSEDFALLNDILPLFKNAGAYFSVPYNNVSVEKFLKVYNIYI